MHRALEIQEILLDILSHFSWPSGDKYALASLARTCRTFKEPALDALWEELYNLIPLGKCVPEAFHEVSAFQYSFTRSLTQTEWDILRSYTRRIRFIRSVKFGIDDKPLSILLNPPTTEPLFPNLHYLSCSYKAHKARVMAMLHLPLPSLASLHGYIQDPDWFQDFLGSFPEFSPNIKRLCLDTDRFDVVSSKLVSSCICRWRNLQIVMCPRIALDMDALVHLSCMPALTKLHVLLRATFPASDSPLFFSSLHDMKLHSESLDIISRSLSQVRLPAIKYFSASISIGNCPSRRELSSFFASIQTFNAGHTIKSFELNQWFRLSQHTHVETDSNVVRPLLDLEHLRPCMAFRSLRHIAVDIEWNVGLTDSEVLALASAWPRLEHLIINESRGWNMLGGITPNGLLQLMQKCPSLHRIALAFDTRGYIELPPSGSTPSLGLTLSCKSYLNVLDSAIEAESVLAISSFFGGIASCPCIPLCAWSGKTMVKPPGWQVYDDRWCDVSRRAKETGIPRCHHSMED